MSRTNFYGPKEVRAIEVWLYFAFYAVKILSGMANSVDPDQIAPSGAVWSESAPFACAICWETSVYKILECLL